MLPFRRTVKLASLEEFDIATMTELLVCFHCCIGDQPQMKRHPRLNRNMIGEPMNFVHITHVGKKEMASSPLSVEQIQERMNPKGGYNNNNSTSPQT